MRIELQASTPGARPAACPWITGRNSRSSSGPMMLRRDPAKPEDVNVAEREAYAMGKRRRARIAPFGHRTARPVDRYECPSPMFLRKTC